MNNTNRKSTFMMRCIESALSPFLSVGELEKASLLCENGDYFDISGVNGYIVELAKRINLRHPESTLRIALRLEIVRHENAIMLIRSSSTPNTIPKTTPTDSIR